jgi:hypothetical protein
MRMGAVKPPTPPKGYVLSEQHGIKEVLEVEAELLRSEGIDPQWPGFPEDEAVRPPRT